MTSLAPTDPSLFAAEVGVVLSMLGVEIALLLWIVPRRGGAPPIARLVFVSTALLGSAGLLLALLWAFEYPGLNSATILLEAAGIGMGFPPGLWMMSLIAFRDRRAPSGGWGAPTLLTALAVAGELLMGLALAVAQGERHAPLGWVGAALTSPWYLGSMAASMVALALWVAFPPTVRAALIGLALSGTAGVVIATDPVAAGLGASAVMGGTLAVVLLSRPLSPRPEAERRWTFGAVLGLLLGAPLGLAAVALPNPDLRAVVFGLGVAAIMTVELLVVIRAGWAATFVPVTPGGTAAERVATSPTKEGPPAPPGRARSYEGPDPREPTATGG